MLTRRQFLASSSLFSLAPTVPLFLARTAAATRPDKDRRILVVVQLDGGNDALNTVVPHGDPTYEKLRPKLRINKSSVIRLTDALGLHPSLKPLDALLQAGNLAVIPGVGYPNPNRSHFESMAIWHTARFDADGRHGYGWLGRALDPNQETAYVVGEAVPGALRGRRSAAVTLSRVEEMALTNPASVKQAIGPEPVDSLLAFVHRQAIRAQGISEQLTPLAGTTNGSRLADASLAERLKLVARMLQAGLGARVFYTVQGGYDTHSNQRYTHASLLSEFAQAIAGFLADARAAKLADRVTLLAFSEFGRTIRENGSAGTDHGTAGVVFLAGPGVRGGVAGTMPSLTDLVAGEPKMTTDFRQVYAGLLEDWLEVPTGEILGGHFRHLPLFRT
jgi:uncharacterized protein (DUF1501 family)